MVEFRRQVLDSINPEESTNAGLWLDKYLESNDDTAKGKLVKQVFDEIKISEAYKKFYQKWKRELTARGIQPKEAKTLGRLAINLGAESTLENSIALNRTYGVPYVPGSALKGLAASYYKNHIKILDEKLYADIFGKQENAGWVIFYDALLVPNGKSLGLEVDVVTVHHPEYYQKDKDVPPPADWDSPIPIHFLSVDGSFSVALDGPQNLIKAAYDILALALAREGIGAKTNSGYGMMQLAGYKTEQNKPVTKSTPATPPKNAVWKKAKVNNDGKFISPNDAPDTKLKFSPEQILPKGFTPAKKADVEFTEEALADGTKRIWVKQLYFPVE